MTCTCHFVIFPSVTHGGVRGDTMCNNDVCTASTSPGNVPRAMRTSAAPSLNEFNKNEYLTEKTSCQVHFWFSLFSFSFLKRVFINKYKILLFCFSKSF
jgi:hypothetical protein